MRRPDTTALPRARLALCLAAALLGACQGRTVPAGWAGYAEGDYVHVAAPIAGRLDRLPVRAGQAVRQGDPLFALDDDAERLALAEAEARAAAAQAQAADAEKGRRAEERRIAAAQLEQALAQAELAQRDLARQQQLAEQGFISRARIDDARAALVQARARVAELQAARALAALPARSDQRAAASAQARAASAATAQQAWREQQKRQLAPGDALVAETFYRVGEFVPAGRPVLALLPPGQVKARFFVPETEVADVAAGQPVQLSCDGCGAPIAATIERVATSAEFTPPVIYSNEQRARLVFMAEARPHAAADAARLRPGQPLQVQRR
jgi:HlyD family secretion protein